MPPLVLRLLHLSLRYCGSVFRPVLRAHKLLEARHEHRTIRSFAHLIEYRQSSHWHLGLAHLPSLGIDQQRLKCGYLFGVEDAPRL